MAETAQATTQEPAQDKEQQQKQQQDTQQATEKPANPLADIANGFNRKNVTQDKAEDKQADKQGLSPEYGEKGLSFLKDTAEILKLRDNRDFNTTNTGNEKYMSRADIDPSVFRERTLPNGQTVPPVQQPSMSKIPFVGHANYITNGQVTNIDGSPNPHIRQVWAKFDVVGGGATTLQQKAAQHDSQILGIRPLDYAKGKFAVFMADNRNPEKVDILMQTIDIKGLDYPKTHKDVDLIKELRSALPEAVDRLIKGLDR